MLPIWIIDLGGSVASQEKLQNLLNAVGESMRPYWHYYHVDDMPLVDIASYKTLIDLLVADGRDCYNSFNKFGFIIRNFQIVILGAADEELTQSVFAPLPGLLRDNLSKIIPDHANLGVEITGILYIPSTINQLDDLKKRTNAAMFLENVNMLNERLGSRHYNHIIAYQDIQYKGVRFYPSLDTVKRTELLFQILINLFYISSNTERLFDKIGYESGIYSLGTASIYYNSDYHHSYELSGFLNKLISAFKNTDFYDKSYAESIVLKALDEKVVNPESITTRLCEGCGSLDVDLKKMNEKPQPHPVWDLFCTKLFSRYYFKFLKYMPARLIKFMQSLSYILLTRFSCIIHKNQETIIEHYKNNLSGLYKKVFLDTATKYATISQMESIFNAAKEHILKQIEGVKQITIEIVPVPKYLKHDYNKYQIDEDDNRLSKIIDDIKKNLKKEPVVLSLITRCFLLGILLVFTIIPVLRVISPKIINLGEIATIEKLWIPILFFLPLTISLAIKLRRHYKRIKRLKYQLLSANLLTINKRLSKYLTEELIAFYNILIQMCDSQLNTLSDLRHKLTSIDTKISNNVIPETMFNQPLLGGEFCGEKLLEDESTTEAEIRINDSTIHISRLEEEDYLSLLKIACRQPDILQAVDLSDNITIKDHISNLISEMGLFYGPQLHIHTADSMGLMLKYLLKNINIMPLTKMAGVNGMLFSVLSNNKPVLRITPSNLEFFREMSLFSDEATKDYAFLTCWQQLTQGIKSQMVCNCQLEPLPELSLADKLSLYYGFYRYDKEQAYILAGTPIRIPKTEMDKLYKAIGG